MSAPPTEERRTSSVGTLSLLAAITGAVAVQAGLLGGMLPDAAWTRLLAAGFEAGVVGGLADWFAVTALFRHPLGLPIPHTRIIVKNRKRLTDGIVNTVEKHWLSPAAIRARLEQFTPSEIVINLVRDPERVGLVAGPLRDVLARVAAMLDDPEVVAFAERSLAERLRELPLGAAAGRWLSRAAESPEMGEVLRSLALSLVRLAQREKTTDEFHVWLLRAAESIRENHAMVSFFLRRKSVQRAIVGASIGYVSSELQAAADDPEHPLRRFVIDGIRGYAMRLEAGDREASAQIESIRAALVESLESGPAMRAMLGGFRRQIEDDLANRESALAQLVERQIRERIPELLAEPAWRERFDRWVRELAADLAERHHHEIGRTVRENLEKLDDVALVDQIESKVGADLQYIRLNGAVVGGLIGVGIAAVRIWLG